MPLSGYGQSQRDQQSYYTSGKIGCACNVDYTHPYLNLILIAHLILDCFNNMALFGDMGCRIGNQGGDRPYSGATCVVDYCAHSHKVKKNSQK